MEFIFSDFKKSANNGNSSKLLFRIIDMALKFMDFVLSYEGRYIMEKNGQGVIGPAASGQAEKVPGDLRKYVK